MYVCVYSCVCMHACEVLTKTILTTIDIIIFNFKPGLHSNIQFLFYISAVRFFIVYSNTQHILPNMESFFLVFSSINGWTKLYATGNIAGAGQEAERYLTM